MIARRASLLATAATFAAFFVPDAHGAIAPTKPQGGLDPSTMVGNSSLATMAAQAAGALPASKLGVAGGVSPLNSCTVRPSRTYAGAVIGAGDLASSANVSNLQATHNTSFYLTSYALTQVPGLSVAAIQSNWAQQAAGIIEVGTDPVVMPDIASQYSNYINTTTQHWTWGGVKGSTWPALISTSGWKPSVAVLNTFGMATTNSLTDPYYLMNVAAIADVKAAAPSLKYVLPYVTANGEQVNAANADTDFTSPYWGESRALAAVGGGLAIDTPANYFNIIREPAYRTLTAQEITWANANGLISEVLLSPYDLAAASGTTPQFQYDATFLQAVQAEVAYLHSHGADPTFYVVANYSEGAGTNAPGSDVDPGGETVNAVALWVARNAPTSPMPAAVPSTLQAEPNALCAPALSNGRNSAHVLASDVDGLNDMASQSRFSVSIGGGAATGLSALSVLSNAPLALGSDGGAPVQLSSDGAGNVTLASANGVVTPNLNLQVNLHIPGAQSVVLNSSGTYPFTLYNDGIGNTFAGSSLANGNFVLSNNIHVTGAQSMVLNSASTYPFSLYADGAGNTFAGTSLPGGNLNLNNNLHITGAQSLVLNNAGAFPFSMNSDGNGNTTLGSSLAGGNVNLTNNLHLTGSQSLVLNSGSAYPFSFSNDGLGNLSLGSSLPSGNVNLTNNLHLTGTQSLVLNAGSAYPFSMNNDGSGNTYAGNPLGTGNLVLSNNLNIAGARSLVLNSDSPYPYTMFNDGLGNLNISTGLTTGNVNLANNLMLGAGKSLGSAVNPVYAATLTTANVGSLVISAPSTPQAATATCSPGAISYDPNYLYVCTGSNTERSIPILAFQTQASSTGSGSGTVTPYVTGKSTTSPTTGTYVQALAADSSRTDCTVTNQGTGTQSIVESATQPTAGTASALAGINPNGSYECKAPSGTLYQGAVWIASTVASDPYGYVGDR